MATTNTLTAFLRPYVQESKKTSVLIVITASLVGDQTALQSQIATNVVRSLRLTSPAGGDVLWPCQTAVATCGEDSHILQPFTSSRTDLILAINKANFDEDRGVDWDKAIAKARDTLNATADGDKVLILFNEDNSCLASALGHATALQTQGVKVLVISIAEEKADPAIAIPADVAFIHIPTFEQLSKLIRELPLADPTCEEPPTISVTRRSNDGVDITIKCKGAATAQVLYLLNTGSHTLESTQPMELYGDDECEHTISAPPNTVIKMKARVVYDDSSVRLTDWVKVSTLRARRDALIVSDPASLEGRLFNLRKRIRDFKPAEAVIDSNSSAGLCPQFKNLHRVRIVSLGPAGVGKSSAAITVDAVAAASGHFNQFRVTRESSDSVSGEIFVRRLEKINPAIEFVDLWGYSLGRPYSKELLEKLCGGNLRHGHRYDSPLNSNSPTFNSQPDISDMMHAVILYFSVHLMTNSAAIDELRLLYAQLQDLGYQCIVVATKADESDTSLASPGQSHRAFTSGQIDALLDAFAKASCIGREYIIPCINMIGGYKSETEEPGIYYMVLSLLDKALDQATAFIANKLQTLGGATATIITPQPIPSGYSSTTSTTSSSGIYEPSTPRTVILRRYGQKKGGERDEIPSSMDQLLALATEYWKITAVSVRDEKGHRIRRINLIQPGQVLELLTKQEEDEAQQREAQ